MICVMLSLMWWRGRVGHPRGVLAVVIVSSSIVFLLLCLVYDWLLLLFVEAGDLCGAGMYPPQNAKMATRRQNFFM